MKPLINVLYITYDGLLDPLGQSQVLPYLKGLYREGYRFHIISFEKKTPTPEDFQRLFGDAKDWNWHWMEYHKSIPIWSQYSMLNKMLRKAKTVASDNALEIVHCRSYFPAWVGHKLQRELGLKFVFDMRGFWADERIEGGIWNANNPLYSWAYRYFKKKESQWFEQCDALISLTETGKSIIANQWNVPATKITVIPCCADLNLFSAERGDSKEYDLGYVGSIGTWYMLEEMVQFFSRYRSQNPNAKMLFLTPENPEVIEEQLSRNSIPLSSVDIRKVPHREVPHWLNKCRYGIYFIRPTFSKKASFPTKLAEYLGLRIPVVTNTGIGDMDQWVQDYKIGILVDDFSKSAMDQVVGGLKDYQYPEAGWEQACQKLDLETGISQYAEVYRKLLV
ncbi:glycosyltransferase [bacterium SCSIO 12741]|nr:glycosyltransferase [bacterium SCSIO 12741]